MLLSERFEMLLHSHKFEAFGLFIVVFFGFLFWHSRRSGWYKLSQKFKTNIEWQPIGKGPIYSTTVTIDKFQIKGAYIVPFDFGVLFYCPPPFSIFNSKFLIPWNQFQNLECKITSILNLTYYEAKVIDDNNKSYILRLPPYVIEYANEIGMWNDNF